MNVQILIDSIVRQTTVLIAQLATSGGLRAPLAHIANQVFLELTTELDAQGVSRRVSADMFGMALRAYLRKIQRARESATARDSTLWDAVYEFIRSRDVVTRKEILHHFRLDDEDLVRGVVHDLTENGFVFTTGVGVDAILRAASDSELGRMRELHEGRIDELLWVLIYREGPIARSRLDTLVATPAERIDAALSRLMSEGRIEPRYDGTEVTWLSRRLAIPLGSPAGWEASVFDHFRAMVRTITQKLDQVTQARPSDIVGGSTFTYEIWPGHPFEAEVRGGLARFRREYGALRDKVAEYNLSHEMPAARTQVTFYGGQSVTEEDRENGAS